MGSGTSTEDKEKQSEKLNAALEMIISNDDLSKLIEQTAQDLNLLTNAKLDIAITGVAGTGKSSLVNALRGMTDFEEGAAEFGDIEKTKETQRYPHPTFPNVTIWDLPGIGTPEFKAEDYLQKVEFSKYDFFIIVASVRFTENDVLLAREIRKMKKKFYYVHTKLDQAMKSERRKAEGRNEPFSEEKIREKIRKDCCDNLAKAGESDSRVFLVSSRDRERYNFQCLPEALGNELDEFKRDALITVTSSDSKGILKKKKAAMEVLIEKVAHVSSITKATPVPGLSLVCDIPFLEARMRDFSKAFGLDEASLRQLARQVGKPFPVLCSAIKKTRIASEIDSEFVKSLLSSTCESGEWKRTYFHSMFSRFGRVDSFAVLSLTLQRFLDDAEEDAANILAEAFKK